MTGACGALGWCGIRNLYSAPSVNTGSDQSRTGRESPESAEIGRDTRLLYALYSFVFRCRMHTFSARKPYCRKGFQICIQCIQRIPTPFVFRFFPLLEPEYMNTANTPAGPNGVIMIRPASVRVRAARPERRCAGLLRASGSGAGGAADLYSAAPVNTCGDRPRTGLRTPKRGEIGRDTPRLYALYSVVFRCRMHTNSARKPYSRKGFQICIQCIQRIPTPFVFRLSLLLGREYMNTVNASGRDGGGGCRRAAACDAASPTGVGARVLYSAALVNTCGGRPRTGLRPPESAEIGRDTRRLYALYSVVFRRRMHTKSAPQPYCRKGFRKCIQCIQRIPTPFVFRLSLLLGPEYMNTANAIGHHRNGGASACGGS